jgi:hypothetical protein
MKIEFLMCILDRYFNQIYLSMSNKRYKTYMNNFSVKKPRRSVYRDRVRRNDLINKKNSYNRAIFESVSALGNDEPSITDDVRLL